MQNALFDSYHEKTSTSCILYLQAVVNCYLGLTFAAIGALYFGHWRPVWREEDAEGERGEDFCLVGQGKSHTWEMMCPFQRCPHRQTLCPPTVAVSHTRGAWLMPHVSLSPCAPTMELPRGLLQPQPQTAWPSSRITGEGCPGLVTSNSQAHIYPFFSLWCKQH